MAKIDQAKEFSNGLYPLLMVKPIVVSSKKKSKKKATKKKAVKKPIPQAEKRESPFQVGDSIWVVESSLTIFKTTITKVLGPARGDSPQYRYKYINPKTKLEELSTEDRLYPACIFEQMPPGCTKLSYCEWAQRIGEVFKNKNLKVLNIHLTGTGIYGYYVIPNIRLIFEEKIHKAGTYGYSWPYTVHKHKSTEHKRTYFPIHSSPQEILSYLGTQVLSKTWKGETEDEN